MRAFGDEAFGGGQADPAGRPGDQGDFAGQIAVGRAQLELIQLQRPVLDPIRFGRAQALKPAHGLAGPDHADRAVIELSADIRLGRVLAGVDHSQTGHQDYPRGRVAQFIARALVLLEVGGVARDKIGHALAQLGPQGGRALLGRPVHKQGLALDVDEVVGAGRAQLRKLGRALAADEIERLGRVVPTQDRAALSRHKPARHRQDLGGQGLALRAREAARLEPAKDGFPLALGVDVVLGLGDDADRVVVALPGRIPPGHQPVLAHDHALHARVIEHAPGDLLAEGETRPDVINPGHPRPKHLARGRFAKRRAGQADEGIRMAVIDVGEGQKGVQQGLDRLARAARFEGGLVQIGDHFFVAHRCARDQGQNVVQPQGGKVAGPHRRDVRARGLDIQHLGHAPRKIRLGELNAGVAAVDVDDAPIAPEQVRAIDQPVEIRQC